MAFAYVFLLNVVSFIATAAFAFLFTPGPEAGYTLNIYSFDWSPYGVHTTIACFLVILSLPLTRAALLSGREAVIRSVPPLLAMFLVSDAFSCFVASQIGYLWHHSFCPWYMAVELTQLAEYLAELAAAFQAACDGPWSAALDLIALAFVPIRALFYMVIVNVVFFAYCYRIAEATQRAFRKLASYIIRFILSLFGL